jgi:hypothetical protein
VRKAIAPASVEGRLIPLHEHLIAGMSNWELGAKIAQRRYQITKARVELAVYEAELHRRFPDDADIQADEAP